MTGFDWKSTLATVAPMIASAIGTPAAGMAVAAGLKVFGITPGTNHDSNVQQLATAMQGATPEQMLAMKQAEEQFQKDMKALNIDLDRINEQDRDSARNMAIKTGRQPQIILSAIYTIAYALVLWAYITGRVNVAQDAQAQFSIILGVLTAAQAQILNFWFGSSSGSKEKDAHMAAIAGSTK